MIDHYSKMIIGCGIEKSASGKAIKCLIQNAYQTHQPEKLQFLTDGGSENVNTIVSNFINSPNVPIDHIIAQKDVVFSNSMIEAINKIIKHQFLYPQEIEDRNQLTNVITKTISIYNTIRLQICLLYTSPSPRDRG